MKRVVWTIFGYLLLITISGNVCAEIKQEEQRPLLQTIAEKPCNPISGIFQFMGDASAISDGVSQSSRTSIMGQVFNRGVGRDPEWVEIIHKPEEGTLRIKNA